MTGVCSHRWMREDVSTKQCVRCGKYAPVDAGNVAGSDA